MINKEEESERLVNAMDTLKTAMFIVSMIGWVDSGKLVFNLEYIESAFQKMEDALVVLKRRYDEIKGETK